MYFEIQILMIIIIRSKCSRVIDQYDQKGLHVSDYCPEIGVCKEGSHVMCTHYNPKQTMGPTCSGVENATMTAYNAALLLDLINSIRSRAARGLAMGYDKELLPRAYGMFRVQWDSELATMAQVWANQCVVERDNCRATKKFPDPGQLASITRFTSDKWIPLSKKNEEEFQKSPGFNSRKVTYGIKSCVRSWYNTHEEIDTETITDKTNSWSDELLRNPYLQIVDGSVTHMGCGTSAFVEYRYLLDTTYLLYNIVRLVCNFSSGVRDRRGIYNTTAPTTEEFTPQCGCPPGYDEDSGCLCYESIKNNTKRCKTYANPKKPQVVVMPIITVEDSPGAYDDARFNRTKNRANKKIQNQQNVKNRRYNPKRQFSKDLSNPWIFELPTRKVNDYKIEKIMKDVKPRKDFSNTKHILANYLSKRKTINLQNNIISTIQNKYRSSLPIKQFKTPKENFRKKHIKEGDEVKANLMQLKSTTVENETKRINVNDNYRRILNNEFRELHNTLKDSFFIYNKRNNIYTHKNSTDNKLLHEPRHENRIANINIKHKNVRRKLPISTTKYQDNRKLKESLGHNQSARYSHKRGPGRHWHKNDHNICNNKYLRSNLRSDDGYIPNEKRIYYRNRLRDIKRNLKIKYNNHVTVSKNKRQS